MNPLLDEICPFVHLKSATEHTEIFFTPFARCLKTLQITAMDPMLGSCDGLRLHYAEKDAIKHVFLKHSFFGRESVLVRYDFFRKKLFCSIPIFPQLIRWGAIVPSSSIVSATSIHLTALSFFLQLSVFAFIRQLHHAKLMHKPARMVDGKRRLGSLNARWTGCLLFFGTSAAACLSAASGLITTVRCFLLSFGGGWGRSDDLTSR